MSMAPTRTPATAKRALLPTARGAAAPVCRVPELVVVPPVLAALAPTTEVAVTTVGVPLMVEVKMLVVFLPVADVDVEELVVLDVVVCDVVDEVDDFLNVDADDDVVELEVVLGTLLVGEVLEVVPFRSRRASWTIDVARAAFSRWMASRACFSEG